MSTKMKGLLKGLRYISQIFEDEKEPEMQIGFPTDVKHVAHIGWDGPSVHSPSWMGKYRATPEFSSAPLGLGVAIDNNSNENAPFKWDSEETTSRRAAHVLESPNRDLPELPKTSRRHSPAESPVREKSEKSKTSRRQHSEGSSRHTKKETQIKDPSLMLSSESPSQSLPDKPKKSSRRKKSKDSSVGGSTRGPRIKHVSNNIKNNVSSSYEAPFSDPGPGTGSGLTSSYQTSTLQAFEEREEKKQGFKAVS